MSGIEAFRKRYGDTKFVSSFDNVSQSGYVGVESRAHAMVGKSLSDLDKMIGMEKEQRRKLFACVNWFNAEKGFGTVVVPRLSVAPENRLTSGEFVELFVHINEIKSHFAPEEGDWILFAKASISHRKLSVKDAELVNFSSEETVALALEHCGKAGLIDGFAEYSHGRRKQFKLNVCGAVLKRCEAAMGAARVREAVSKCLAEKSPEDRGETVQAILSSSSATLEIKKLYLPATDDGTQPKDEVSVQIRAALLSSLLSSQPPRFSEIPVWCDLSGNRELMGHIVSGVTLIGLGEIIRHDVLPLENLAFTVVSRVNDAMADSDEEVWRFAGLLIDNEQDRDRFLPILAGLEGFSESANALLFSVTGDETFWMRIADIPALVEWLQAQTPFHLLMFLRNYAPISDPDAESDSILSGVQPEKVAAAICLLPETERYGFLTQFPKADVLSIVWGQFRDDVLFVQCIGEIWNAEKSKVPYVAFDLESDGELIREFAFRAKGNTRAYDGEEQLDSLKNALSQYAIVVGHNIKNWDLPVLRGKGIEVGAFVWDTLEIELLLDPCRYAYSLHAAHHAKEDVELTDALFWDQLYRLSCDPGLCDRFSDFFPAEIRDILESLHKPWYVEYFKREARQASSFFQTPGELDASIVKALANIGPTVGDGTALVVAPRELWGYLAQHATVSFLDSEGMLEFAPLDRQKIANHTYSNPLHRAILERYIEKVETPVPANLAQYLRIKVFPDDVLRNLVTTETCKVRCVDADGFAEAVKEGPYDHLFLVGTDLVNRMRQFRLAESYSAEAFLDAKCWIPMRLASSGFVSVESEDRQKIVALSGSEKIAEAKNVWVERLPDGLFSVGYSVDFQRLLERAREAMPDVAVHELPWNRINTVSPESVLLVTSERPDGSYDPTESRVTSVASVKAAYWVYQFKLLEAVRHKEGANPIVYVVDDAAEVAPVRDYAVRKGFQVPPAMGLAAEQTWMRRRLNALTVVSRDELAHFLALRSDAAFAVVFDRLSVEKCLMMWQGLPFGDEAKLAGESDIGNSGVHHIGTPRDAMLSAWAVLAHYQRLVHANNGQSRVYLLDPYLDDYPELADSWHVGLLAAPL